MVPYKNSTPCKKISKGYLPRDLPSDFLKRNSQICCMIRVHGHGILKSFSSSLCLIAGVGFIIRVLVVLQKTNNVIFEMLFL